MDITAAHSLYPLTGTHADAPRTVEGITTRTARKVSRHGRPFIAMGAICMAMVAAIPAFAVNSAPTAVASVSPSIAYPGDTVTVSGTGSHSNPTGSSLIYLWQQTGGTSVVFSPSAQTQI